VRSAQFLYRTQKNVDFNVNSILMNVQPMTRDDFRQFGSVEYIQQRTNYRTLGHSTHDCLRDGQLTVVGDLLCAACEERRSLVEHGAGNADANL